MAAIYLITLICLAAVAAVYLSQWLLTVWGGAAFYLGNDTGYDILPRYDGTTRYSAATFSLGNGTEVCPPTAPSVTVITFT